MVEMVLTPAKHEPPVCLDYQSLDSVQHYERQVRVHRAFRESFAIDCERSIDGRYVVRGEKGRAYVVDIVGPSRQHDTCSCPDFLTNHLGDCKHIEGVYRLLDSSTAAEQLPLPDTATLTVDGHDNARLLTLGGWSDAQLNACGLERVSGNVVRPRLDGPSLRAGRLPEGVRVTHAAVGLADQLRTRERLRTRAEQVRDAFERGKLGLDVLRFPLFPYQSDGVSHMVATGRTVLADDMGLGKTIQAIAACELLRRRGEATRILVVCPASLKDQWAREIERATGERAIIVGGSSRARARAISLDAPYKILNYELTWRELQPLQALDADVLVIDEAQRAKNFRSKTARTLRSLPSRFLFVLTGTPIENRLDDLYALMQLVDPAILGPLWRFNFDFHVQAKHGKVLGCKNLSTLRLQIAPRLLRRRKEDVLMQLPSLTEQTRYTLLTEEQASVEAGYRGEAAKLMAIAERRPLRLEEQRILQALLLKARQACNALELCEPERGQPGSPKLDEFEALVSEIADQGTSKVLVFSEWVEMLKLAALRLDALGIGYAMLHGGVPTERRPDLLQRFRDDVAQRVLLSTDAGGVGLNLQVATYVVHLDLPWNPARLDQRTARAHRIGQTRGVSVTYLCAVGGIERGIEGTLSGKRAVRSAALDVTSEVESIDSIGFGVFLRQIQATLAELERMAGDGSEATVEATEVVAQETELAAGDAPEVACAEEPTLAEPELPEPAAAPEMLAVTTTRRPTRAHDRLRLARVVLDAGFAADAVRAASEALSTAIAALGEGVRAEDHAALVAFLYRELVPQGRVPAAVPGVLARLHDLTLLEGYGVEVDVSLARCAVDEANEWVCRLAPETT
jgi:superfamily II DNA or RNA helicase